ncbi:MAG: TonB-dependent receptor [Balneolaceae bacterium]|nr:TonB-dependent receptor [Balneolaceae bacterium]MBO6547688.1 TonB-dependent receptor [Balneolaceae bacterium]MBO6648199.1 TonB-dependent receptor [Balneolaceae bacterium]
MSKIITLVLAGFLCSLSSQAQTTQPIDTVEFKEVVVTASKMPISLRETTKPVLVIDQETISQNSGKDVAQLLSEQSGIYVNGAYSNGGKDKATYLQGASTRYTLFLIDGLPVYDPSTIGGVFDIRNLSLDAIERIEVVKGSMSTLYGSDAIAGVVNIITKESGRENIRLNASSSTGSFATYRNQIGLNGAQERGSFSILYSREESEGISEARDNRTREMAQNSPDFDKDGFTKNTISAKVSVKPNSNLTIIPRVLINTFEGGYDGGAFSDAPNTFDSDFFNPGVTLKYQNEVFFLQSDYSYSNTNRKNVAAFGGEFEGKLHNYDIYGVYTALESLQFLAGFNYQNMEIGSNERTSDLYSPYFTARIRNPSGINGETGIRLNTHSEYGSNITVSGSASYQFSKVFKVLSSVGTGFKAPTLDELYGPFGANPDLDPEKSIYFNVGSELSFPESSLNFTGNFFIRNITDVIIYSFPGYLNQDEQDDKGIEFFGSYSPLAELQFSASFDYLIGSSVVNGEKTDNLLRRPKTKVVLSSTVIPFSGFNFSVQGSYLGERDDIYFKPDFSSEIVTLDEVFLLNANASYLLFEDRITVFGDIKNILDTDYSEVYGFNTTGRAWNLGVKISLK